MIHVAMLDLSPPAVILESTLEDGMFSEHSRTDCFMRTLLSDGRSPIDGKSPGVNPDKFSNDLAIEFSYLDSQFTTIPAAGSFFRFGRPSQPFFAV
jgi:hypothetical protein